ncbi:MAG TPA: hypothetical protein VHJ82_07290 [Actinomycetota bacterium]|nr:hypothetical protein [Actinomycetota bacterium]
MTFPGRKALIGLALGAICVLPLTPATAAEADCLAQYETLSLKTFHVVLTTPKKVYDVDDLVPVQVEVSRPAHEDPLGQNQPIDPPTSQPAEGVLVGIGLQVGRTYLFGIGTTDDVGKTTINVPLPEYVPAGKVFARSLAWNIVLDTTCLRVEEQGYAERKNFFTVRK